MSRDLQFSDIAREHLASIGRVIAESASTMIADAFIERLVLKCARLASLPGTLGTGRPDLGKDFRSTPHKGYIIYFRYVDDVIEIIGLLDAHRDALAYFGNGDPEA